MSSAATNAREAARRFKQQFGYTPTHTVTAPGRLELLGNHTDYNLGLVMAAAINRFLSMAVSPRKDGRIELFSSAFPGKESFSITNLAKNPEAPWANYVKGVLLQLKQHRVSVPGFNAAIHGTLPIGAGLSSSAALEVATALAIRQLSPYTLTPTGCTLPPVRDERGELPPLTTQERLEIARLCQTAEDQFVGVHCGILDQMTGLFGKAFTALEIDCESLAVEHLPLYGDVAIVVCHSGVEHNLVSAEYNERREQCAAAARALGVPALRRVDLKFLTGNRQRLDDRQYDCAYHVVGEIQRVIFGSRALREGDVEQFGQYMFQSHESSRDFFKNSCPELDTLVEIARAHPDCLGARLTGGGFGGATINLVRRGAMPCFVEHMTTAFAGRTGRGLELMLCETADGAC